MDKDFAVFLLFSFFISGYMCGSFGAGYQMNRDPYVPEGFALPLQLARANFERPAQRQALREFCQFIHIWFSINPYYPTSDAYMAALQAYARLPYLLPDGRVNPDLRRLHHIFISDNHLFNCVVSNAIRLLKKIENPLDRLDFLTLAAHRDYLERRGQRSVYYYNRSIGMEVLC